MTGPNTDSEQPGDTPEQPAEIDLNAFLQEQQQYARDVNAQFEAMNVTADSTEWTQWCDEMTAWNEAVAEEAASSEALLPNSTDQS